MTAPAASRPLKDPVPDRACGTCGVAICCATSPDRDAQVAAFDRDHPEMLGHVRVRRLPQDHGDPSWSYDGPKVSAGGGS